jgi:outer membrane protein assembly factor BamB/tRNA A-37 threonylcarbamoyl transferase component Bud32
MMTGIVTKKLEDDLESENNRGREGRLKPGSVIQERYKIMTTLGTGGFSSVYQAQDLHFPNVTRLCAVKEMIHANRDPRIRELATTSFEREASILATLDHPSVPEVHDFFTQDDRSYLVLEYIRGNDLETLMAERDDYFPTDSVLQWSLQLCEVLGYLHSRRPQAVVFRDLKPSNVMLDTYGRIRLIDFNIAKSFEAGARGTMIGTEGYSPPEQYRGASSPAGDVYAFGATMHHILTRQDPRMEPPFSFADRPISAVNFNVPADYEAIINRCLAYEVEERFPDALELREALLMTFPRLRKNATAPYLTKNKAGKYFAPQTPEFGPSLDVAEPDSAAKRKVDSGLIKAIWTFRCEDEIRSTPALSHGMVYVGAYDNNLYAINADTGEFKWKFASSGGIASSPFVYKETVLTGSSDGHVYSLKRESGQLNWRFQTGASVFSSPIAEFDHVFFGSDDGYLYAVSISTGRKVWQNNAHQKVRSSPCLSSEYIYFGTEGGYVFCLDLSGKPKWQFPTKRAVMSSPVFGEDMIFIGSKDSGVYALDANSGFAIWRKRTRRPIVSSPALANGALFIGSSDGYLYSFDMYTGREFWSFQTDGQVNSTPAIYEDALYFGSTDGSVYCLSIDRGKLRWRFETEAMIVGSPKVENGIVYVGSCDNNLYALPA